MGNTDSTPFNHQVNIAQAGSAAAKVFMGDADEALKVQKQFAQGLAQSTVPSLFMFDFIRNATPAEAADTSMVGKTCVACDFGGVELSEWTRAIDDAMVVACEEVVDALNKRMKSRCVDHLKWDDVVKVFCNCQCITEDQGCTKHIRDGLKWDETNYFKFDGSPDVIRKQEIAVWLKKVMNDNQEQSTVDNAIIFNEKTVDELAAIASQSGATVKDIDSLMAANERESKKVMEISVIRFPNKECARIKIYRIVLFAWFQCQRVMFVQHDESGFDLEYDTFEFKPNMSAINTSQSARARKNLTADKFNF